MDLTTALPTEFKPLNMEQVFIVDRILKKRYRKGEPQYLVKWQGYTSKHNTWEPVSNILDYNLIAAFETKSHRRRSAASQELYTERSLKRKLQVNVAEDEEEELSSHSSDSDLSPQPSPQPYTTPVYPLPPAKRFFNSSTTLNNVPSQENVELCHHHQRPSGQPAEWTPQSSPSDPALCSPPSPPTTPPQKDFWCQMTPKKFWQLQEIMLTEVTYNQVTVTFQESPKREGFFRDRSDSA